MRVELSDNQLLQKVVLGDSKAAANLYLRYKTKVFNIAYKYSKNFEDAEERTQEVFLKLFKFPEKLKKIESFDSWIPKVAKNHCLDYLGKIKNETDKRCNINNSDIVDKDRSNCPEHKYVEEVFKMLSEIEKLKTIKPQFLKGLERSIYYILHIYQFKEECDFKQKSALPFIKARTILLETKSAVENIFGPPSEKEVMKTYRTLRPGLSKEDKNQIDNIFREPIHYLRKLQFLRGPFMKNYEEKADELIRQHGFSPKKMKILQVTSFPRQLDKMVMQSFFCDDNKEFFDLSCQYLAELIKKIDEEIQKTSTLSWNLFNLFPDEFKNLLGNIDKLKIDPPTLIFRVWVRAFRKNKKTNLKLIKNLLLEFKKKNKKTLWNPLFESLDESLNAETWRKKIYKPSVNKKFYDDLSDLIYKKSFVEKVSINPWRE